jgi:hypothetical protein|nr:MAG TPA: hypothetical protein [Caudoviricetes sp.]
MTIDTLPILSDAQDNKLIRTYQKNYPQFTGLKIRRMIDEAALTVLTDNLPEFWAHAEKNLIQHGNPAARAVAVAYLTRINGALNPAVNAASSTAKWFEAVCNYIYDHWPDKADAFFAQQKKDSVRIQAQSFANCYQGCEAVKQWRTWIKHGATIRYEDNNHVISDPVTGETIRLKKGREGLFIHARYLAQMVIEAYNGDLAAFGKDNPDVFG